MHDSESGRHVVMNCFEKTDETVSGDERAALQGERRHAMVARVCKEVLRL